ncbi:unnamed protein product [Heligmosomoides polygyrus]|uniref:Recep_L_domain domain-containing protein n=1 Tax=Heligmosomoides polygyrus TaxID=6339 RepID=A0A183GW21_HELPZ|nr:unnamed protein product [Heligmosomoides polygyrus]
MVNQWCDTGLVRLNGVALQQVDSYEMLNELNVAGMKIGLDMNKSKTQFMVKQWCDTVLVRINGVALQQVDSYVYLGRELIMSNNLASEIATGDAQHGQP